MPIIPIFVQVPNVSVFWVAAAPAAWDSDSWALSSGGAAVPAMRPSSLDVATFDGNGLGNCTLDADVGTLTDGGDGAYTLEPHVYEIIFDVAYTGTFDVNGFDLVIGADGMDGTAAAATTLLGGSGTIASQGDILFTGTFTRETSTLLADGGTVGTPLVIDFGASALLYGVASSASSVISIPKYSVIYGPLSLYGTASLFSFYIAGTPFLTGAAAAISGSLTLAKVGGTVTVQNASDFSPSSRMYGGTFTTSGGVVTGLMTFGNSQATTINVAAGTKITSLVFDDYSTAATVVDFDDVSVHGNIAQTGAGAGTLAATGTIVLDGTANQAVSIDAVDLSGATFAGLKTGGTVTLSTSISIDSSGFYAPDLTTDDTITIGGTGTIYLENLLTVSAGVLTLNADVYCCGYVVSVGATRQGTGTIYYGPCGKVIDGTDTGPSVQLPASGGVNIDIDIDI